MLPHYKYRADYTDCDPLYRVSKRSPKYSPSVVRYAIPHRGTPTNRHMPKPRYISARFEAGVRVVRTHCVFSLVVMEEKEWKEQASGTVELDVVYRDTEACRLDEEKTREEVNAAFPGLDVQNVRYSHDYRDRDGRRIQLVQRMTISVTLASIRLKKLALLADDGTDD